MVTAVLKLYFIGTALSVLAVIYGIVDSFGGLMYEQNHRYMWDLHQQTQTETQPSSISHRRGSAVTRNTGS